MSARPFATTLPAAPHRRFNPLLSEWVLVSAQRTQRPWDGSQERVSVAPRPAYDPKCYLCPGNERANGAHNPPYAETFVFTNDFPALVPDVARSTHESGLLRAETEPGTSRVICFSPRHDLTLAQMNGPAIKQVIDVWAEQTQKLGEEYRWVQVFENRGEAMGASNPHPHGQIWAGSSVPDIPAREHVQQVDYHAAHQRTLLSDYLEQELADGSRVVTANDHFVVVVPFWAVWPFETMIIPRRPFARLPDASDTERLGLGDILGTLLRAYDEVFATPFPYSMGWHGAPTAGADPTGWHFHGHAYPPLLRSATVRKFMVGYELLAGVQRDVTAETAAERLRALVGNGVT